MFLEGELRKYVELAEEALKLRDGNPTRAIKGLVRVRELMEEYIEQALEFEIMPDEKEQKDEIIVMKRACFYFSTFEAAKQNEWYRPMEKWNGRGVRVSDIRRYLDNWKTLLSQKRQAADEGMPELKSLDDSLSYNHMIQIEDYEREKEEISVTDLLVSDLFKAISNEIEDLADEAYVRGFIDKKEKEELYRAGLQDGSKRRADKKPHFSIKNSDEEVVKVLKGLQTEEWNNNRVKDIGLIDESVTEAEWLSALKGPAPNRKAATRKIPFKAKYICKSFVAQYLDGDYELAEKVFCLDGGEDIKGLRNTNIYRRKDICDLREGKIARIIREAKKTTDKSR